MIIFNAFKSLPDSFTNSVIADQNGLLQNLPSELVKLEMEPSKKFFKNLRPNKNLLEFDTTFVSYL